MYQSIFSGLESCASPLACMERAAQGGFAYISWKVGLGRQGAENKQGKQSYEQCSLNIFLSFISSLSCLNLVV